MKTRTVLTRRVSSYGLPAWVSSELSSRLQLGLDVRNLSLWRRHLVNAYEVKAGTV